MTNSKNIGGSYEREFARKFSEFITGSSEKLVCWRQTHSGSISTIDKKKGKDGSATGGDFQCLDSNYQYIFDLFHIDSKSYKEFNSLFTNKKNIKSNVIFKQWIKTCNEADENNKIPLMPCKIRDSKTGEFILVPNYLNFYFKEKIKYYLTKTDKDYSCSLIYLDDFFESNNIIDLVKNNLKIKDVVYGK